MRGSFQATSFFAGRKIIQRTKRSTRIVITVHTPQAPVTISAPTWKALSASTYPTNSWKATANQPHFWEPISLKVFTIATAHGGTKRLNSRKESALSL